MRILQEFLHWGTLITGIVISLALLYAVVVFYRENERLALSRTLLLLLLIPAPVILIFVYRLEVAEYVVVGIAFILCVLFVVPFKTPAGLVDKLPADRIDERDIMFSRNELVPGTERYEKYYLQNPQNKVKDDAFREEAGLLSPKSKYYHQKAFTASEASFRTIDQLHDYVDGEPSNNKKSVDKDELTKFLKGWAKDIGAIDVGITKVHPYHFYTFKGRRDDYDKPIEIKHKTAIAFTVEMTHEMVAPAPQASIIMESARQYLESGRIAVQLAGFIRELGYNARAHIDGNYQVICPLVARDAGLGEIGRMGLLMTPKLGPRVRIGVVTTDLELEEDEYIPNNSAIDFCVMCKKCAECCPSQSIQFENPVSINGVKRWQINSEACFTYWCKAGTDCGRCMAVCPYSHPNQALHNFIRWGIKNSRFFRKIAVLLDDFFYARKPKPHKLPSWLK